MHLFVDRDRPGRSMVRALAIGATCIAATLGGSVSAAQATPEAIAPAPSCTIAPLTLPLFGGTPPARFIATPEAVDVAHLAPVDAATDTSVRAGVAEILACLNVGEPKQTWAIFTTGYLARTYGDPGSAYLPAFEQSLDAAPVNPPPVYTIQGFTIDGQTPDGRVVVSLTLAAGSEVWADQLVLAQVDGHWLVDETLT
ncbi:MAG: hypothetical protein ACTHMX_15480 [Thermomicrobiales bacterium]